MSESKVRPIPASIAQTAHVNEQQYLELYARSIADPDGFWAEQAAAIDWFSPATSISRV